MTVKELIRDSLGQYPRVLDWRTKYNNSLLPFCYHLMPHFVAVGAWNIGLGMTAYFW